MAWNGVLEQKAAYWRRSAKHYKATSEENGALPRSDWWRYEYCQSPYLMLASDEYIAQRWLDQYHNNVSLTAARQIAPRHDQPVEDLSAGSRTVLRCEDDLEHPHSPIFASRGLAHTIDTCALRRERS